MVIREQEIYPKVKYWIRPNIENRIKEGSIKAYFNSRIVEIRPSEVVLDTPEGERIIANDFVLAMTGYMPNFKLFEQLGLPISDDEDKTPLHNPETLETPLPGVYVAGVINAGLQTSKLFIENTRVHAQIILAHMVSKDSVSA